MGAYWYGLLDYLAVVFWLFVALYATRPFYRSATGWNYLLFMLTFALMFTMLASGGRDGEWRIGAWTAGLTSVAILATHRVALLIHGIWLDHREGKP